MNKSKKAKKSDNISKTTVMDVYGSFSFSVSRVGLTLVHGVCNVNQNSMGFFWKYCSALNSHFLFSAKTANYSVSVIRKAIMV